MTIHYRDRTEIVRQILDIANGAVCSTYPLEVNIDKTKPY